MRRKAVNHDECPMSQAAEDIGDAWTILILRNLFNGMDRFDDLQKHLEIPTNTLTDRLKRLCDRGILTRKKDPEDARRVTYRLTPKGGDLYPILIALVQWGERWLPSPKGDRLQLISKTDGQPIAKVRVTDQSGRPLQPRDVTPTPGPAASDRARKLYGKSW